MSRRTRTSNVVQLADLGPRIQRDRGDLVVSNAEADPEQPNRTVRRAKRQWAPDILLSKGTITLSQHVACVRYLSDYEIGVCGARHRSDVYVDRSGGPAGPGDVQLQAATGYRLATQAIGITQSGIMSSCVLGHMSASAWADQSGCNPNHAVGYLTAAIARLADHYGC